MKKLLLSILALFVLSAGLLYAKSSDDDDDDSNSSSFTSTDNIKNAQIAISSNEYIVTAGDIYTLAYSGGSFSLSVDSTYKVRVANLGIIDARGLTLQEFKNKVESLIINNYPTYGVQFFLANPAAFQVYIKGEVKETAIIETWAMQRAADIIEEHYTDFSSKRLFSIISADGKEKKYDLYKAQRDGDLSQNPYLRPGDTIVVNKLDRSVTISGAVKRPGTYELLPGEEINSLIFDYACGFSPYADKDNISVSRFVGGKDFYNISFIKETDLHTDIPLACYDKVVVNSNLSRRSMLFVEGAVRSDYNYATESNVESDYPTHSGSMVEGPITAVHLSIPYVKGITCKSFILQNSRMLTNYSDLAHSYVLRTNSDGSEEKIFIDLSEVINPSGKNVEVEDIILESDDKIVIPYTAYYVLVNGAVISPGRYGYQPGKTWEYYVGIANGFNLDQNLFGQIKITDKNGKRLSKKSVIPPEAHIYASRNSPNGGWVIPLIISIMSFISTCFTFYGAVKGFQP